jgi:hypothetical protein
MTIARPSSTTTTGTWTASTGGALHTAIDEVTASDADFISTLTDSSCVMGLSATTGTRRGHDLRVRAWSPIADGLEVEVRQGNTLIALRQIANLHATPTTYNLMLTPGEAATITDYSALTLHLTALDATDPVTYAQIGYVDFDYVE